MERGNRGKRILSAVMLLVLVTALSCYAAGRSGKEASDEETMAAGMEVAGAETVSELTEPGEGSPKMEEQDARETEGEEFSEEEAPGEEELVFGRGIESEESLAEWVVTAMKSGDTESLVGVPFGEEFDYDLYERERDECLRKEPIYDRYLRYLFDGEGHRFSGFSISSSGESFLGLNLEKCPASVFVKAFGEPDTCEKTDFPRGGSMLKAGWYFEKAVLTVEDYGGYVGKIEYNALGNAADGDETEKKSDFEQRMEEKAENEQVETICEFWFEEHEKDVFYPSEDDRSGAGSAEEFVEKYLDEHGFGDQTPDSVIYDEEGSRFAESYRNDEMDQFAFVIYDGGKVCCAVRKLPGTEQPGHIVYRCDENGNTVQETLYDEWGMRAADASYRYHDSVPFPFIAEGWNLRDEGEHFCREHKMCFYEESVESVKRGRVKATGEAEEWNAKRYFRYPCFFIYRSDGKLERIREEIPEDRFAEELLEYRESYFGGVEFSYDGGVLKKVEYHHSSEVYGTGDMGGTVDFDEQGRMVHNYYYVTSGCHDEFYFYHGDERKPWAVLDWCHDIWSVDVYRPVEEVYP